MNSSTSKTQGTKDSPKNEGEIGELRMALPQFIAVSIKNILLFGYGLTLGFPTVIIPAIQGGAGKEMHDIILNKEQISWFSSINLICVPMGSIFSGLLTQPFGKRRAMQLVNIPILISWLLFHFATNINYLYASLCLAGLSGGLMEAAVLTYVSEISQPKYRGILAASGSTCVIMGVFIQFILGSLLDWRTIAAVCTVFPVLSAVCLFFVPESPHWLIQRNRLEDAIKSLAWLRGWVPKHCIEQEFDQLYEDLIVIPEQNASKSEQNCLQHNIELHRHRSFWIPFALIAFTFVVGHFSGKTTLQTYAVQIFHSLKAPIDKYHATILLGLAELIGTVLCVILIHFTGKRKLVLISTVGSGLCFFGTATYAHYLNILPGFGVSNVVTNASKSISTENVITSTNLSKIFEIEERAFNLTQNYSTYINNEAMNEFNFVTIQPQALRDLVYFYTNDSSTEHLNLSFYDDYEDLNSSGGIQLYNITDVNHDILYNDTDVDHNLLYNVTNVHHDLLYNVTHVDRGLYETEIVKTVNGVNKTESEGSKISEKILVPIPKQKVNKLLWVPLLLLLASACLSHLGIRLIPWILIGELFPLPIRSSGSGISGGVGYLFGFLANKFFLPMVTTMTLPGVFWFNASVSLFGAIVIYFVLPETEGKSLTEIEHMFSGKKIKNDSEEVVVNRGMNETTERRCIPPEVQYSNAIGLKRTRKTANLPEGLGIDNKGFETNKEDTSCTTHL